MISRRRFIETGLGGFLTLSGCTSIEEADNAFYCQTNLVQYNPGLCSQLKIWGIVQRFRATLSMLFGVQRDAQISTVLERQVQLEARAATQSEILHSYVKERRESEKSARASNVVSNIQSDTNLCKTTHSDLLVFLDKIDNFSKLSYNEKVNVDAIHPRIVSAARKNIASFQDGNWGYSVIKEIDFSFGSDEVKKSNDELYRNILRAQDTFKYLA